MEANQSFFRKDFPFILFTNGVSLCVFLLLFIPSMTRYWALLLLGIDLLYIVLRKNITIKINFNIILWGVFLIIIIFGVTLNYVNVFDAMQFVFSVALFLLTYIIFIQDASLLKPVYRNILYILLFFLLGSVLQIFFPNLVMEINRLHLSPELFNQSYVFYRNGALNGFTYQTGMNGYLLSFTLAFFFPKLINERNSQKRILYLLFYVILYFILFLTEKRGFIVFNFIIFALLLPKVSKVKWKSIFVILAVLLAILVIIMNTEIGQELIFRTLYQDDLTTGRIPMWKVMWNDFLNNPVIGNGTYTTINVVENYNGHNIYLQVLREMGIIGFCIFILILLLNSLKTYLHLDSLPSDNKDILVISLYMQLIFVMWGITGNPLYDNYPLLIYFICIVATTILTSKETKYSKNI